MSNKTGQGRERAKPPNGNRQTARARRSLGQAKDQAPKTRGGYPAGGRTVSELPPPPDSITIRFEHPGVMAAGGPVTPEECEHPAGRRDPKNPAFCRACGTGGLEPPARRRS